MRFRLGLIIGFVAGYILGARAGRERYEQISETFRRIMERDTVRRATGQTKDTIGEVLTTAAQTIRDRVDR